MNHLELPHQLAQVVGEEALEFLRLPQLLDPPELAHDADDVGDAPLAPADEPLEEVALLEARLPLRDVGEAVELLRRVLLRWRLARISKGLERRRRRRARAGQLLLDRLHLFRARLALRPRCGGSTLGSALGLVAQLRGPPRLLLGELLDVGHHLQPGPRLFALAPHLGQLGGLLDVGLPLGLRLDLELLDARLCSLSAVGGLGELRRQHHHLRPQLVALCSGWSMPVPRALVALALHALELRLDSAEILDALPVDPTQLSAKQPLPVLLDVGELFLRGVEPARPRQARRPLASLDVVAVDDLEAAARRRCRAPLGARRERQPPREPQSHT